MPPQDTTNWGSKLKLDVSKPILGLTCHPTDPSLIMLLHADGGLRCYQVWMVVWTEVIPGVNNSVD